jgi:hypothetical protein
VLQLGYEDTWRWRMSGGENGVRDHRQWWTGVLSSVAYAPRIPRATTQGIGSPAQTDRVRAADDEAPLANLVANIGPSTSMGSTSSSRPAGTTMLWLFIALAAALAGEIASRRMRGAP